MPRFKFSRDSLPRETGPDESFEAGKVYDLDESSVQRWERRRAGERVKAGRPAKTEASNAKQDEPDKAQP